MGHRASQNEQVSELMARFKLVCQDPVTSSYDSCPSQCRELMLEVMSYMGCCSFETLPQNAKCGVFCLAASCNLSSVGECSRSQQCGGSSTLSACSQWPPAATLRSDSRYAELVDTVAQDSMLWRGAQEVVSSGMFLPAEGSGSSGACDMPFCESCAPYYYCMFQPDAACEVARTMGCDKRCNGCPPPGNQGSGYPSGSGHYHYDSGNGYNTGSGHYYHDSGSMYHSGSGYNYDSGSWYDSGNGYNTGSGHYSYDSGNGYNTGSGHYYYDMENMTDSGSGYNYDSGSWYSGDSGSDHYGYDSGSGSWYDSGSGYNTGSGDYSYNSGSMTDSGSGYNYDSGS